MTYPIQRYGTKNVFRLIRKNELLYTSKKGDTDGEGNFKIWSKSESRDEKTATFSTHEKIIHERRQVEDNDLQKRTRKSK